MDKAIHSELDIRIEREALLAADKWDRRLTSSHAGYEAGYIAGAQSLRSELQKSRDYASLLEKEIIELQKQKELNAELVKAADGLLTSLPNRAENYPWYEHANDLESLIKKSKES